MNDAFVMGFFESRRDLPRDVESFFERDRTALQTLRQVLAVDELENEKRLTVVLFETMNRGDVRMVRVEASDDVFIVSSQPLFSPKPRLHDHARRRQRELFS